MHCAAAAAPLPRTWQLQRAGVSLAQPPELRLPLADPLRFVEQHRERLGAHARAVRGLAPEVASSPGHPTRSASLATGLEGSCLREQALLEAVGSLKTPCTRVFAPLPFAPPGSTESGAMGTARGPARVLVLGQAR